MHVLFPREGRSDEPVRYEAQRHHEGKTFAALTILARQDRGVIATASVSMHTAEEGPASRPWRRSRPCPGRSTGPT
jgi:acyl-CoA thioesterase II